jgi:hypothetical protein
MALKLRFEISPRVISTEAQLDETLLMNTQTLAYFGLDPLGGKFWRAMQLHQDADQVIAAVAAETDKNPMELEPVLQSIMTGMERSGLITTHKY